MPNVFVKLVSDLNFVGCFWEVPAHNFKRILPLHIGTLADTEEDITPWNLRIYASTCIFAMSLTWTLVLRVGPGFLPRHVQARTRLFNDGV
jgi:hypothetical protein